MPKSEEFDSVKALSYMRNFDFKWRPIDGKGIKASSSFQIISKLF